ncbi:hypothetical protein THITH_09500 [Thioalkalivibrio paradoxus ARh 1]|uniref:Uncharacterized protein n=1 Tax=Thioalkalivibrio paradoxus ARh 1 TaxID=713585 RepID=W0DSY9_9GAMM|nr:hypothetical protein THITH_09500 [Thioalkalivibrio paradoxus ARh 1]
MACHSWLPDQSAVSQFDAYAGCIRDAFQQIERERNDLGSDALAGENPDDE